MNWLPFYNNRNGRQYIPKSFSDDSCAFSVSSSRRELSLDRWLFGGRFAPPSLLWFVADAVAATTSSFVSFAFVLSPNIFWTRRLIASVVIFVSDWFDIVSLFSFTNSQLNRQNEIKHWHTNSTFLLRNRCQLRVNCFCIDNNRSIDRCRTVEPRLYFRRIRFRWNRRHFLSLFSLLVVNSLHGG